MQNKALVDLLDETLTGTNTEILGNTLSDVETLALVDTMAHTLPGAEANTVKNTLVNVRVEALVDTLDDNLQEAEAERHWDMLGDVKAEPLADPLAVMPAEGRGKALDETNSYTLEEAVAKRLGETWAMWWPRH